MAVVYGGIGGTHAARCAHGSYCIELEVAGAKPEKVGAHDDVKTTKDF